MMGHHRTCIFVMVQLLVPGCIAWTLNVRLVGLSKVGTVGQGGVLTARLPITRLARMTPEEEKEEREVQEELQRKIRGMFNAEGKPYAPWMTLDIEAQARAIRLRRAREREAESEAVIDPQGQEMSGVGLKYRVVNDRDVELGWVTGEEKDNLGFIVSRRRADEQGDEFIEIASFKTYPPLNTKAPDGGAYMYVDPDVEPGQYIYRISDQDKRGKRTVLCQAGLEVQSQGEKIKNAALLAVFAAVILGGAVASVLYDSVS